ncbi:hypothetical protein SOVF_079580 [Spinacia oleracea]|nr:hypothetical protein SOVF_079580 [Spinacia oleracea]
MREPLLGTSNGGLKTLPFIIANEAFEKAASFGLLPNMILYLMRGYGMELATGSNIIFFWNAATNFTPVIGAFLADSYVGRFWMIGFGSIFSFLGMIFLWLTAIIPGATPCDDSGSECKSWNVFQLTLLVSAFGLMSIGAGGIRSASLAFGADQLLKKDNFSDAGILERFLNWYYSACCGAVVVGVLFVVYIQDHFGWKVGFGVSVVLMLLSALSFFSASTLYIKFKAKAGSLIAFAQVLMVSWKKRNLNFSEDELYYQSKGSRLLIPSDKLRFLNKACIVGNAEEELTPDGVAIDPWNLCTVNQVEEVKALIKVIPMWSTGIMMSVTTTQFTFPVLQAGSMDRHITSNFQVPAGSFGTFTVISIILWIAIYDRIVIPLATKITGKPGQLSVRKRMGVGLILSFMSMVVCAIIEGVRRETAIKEGFSDDPKAVTDMSAYWLLFHHWISGMAEALFLVGQNEFFYSEFPKSMSSVATTISGLSTSVASLFASLIMSSINSITSKGGKESWVSSNINRAHFDYYYWLLAGLSFLNFLYYLLCSRAYGPPSYDQDRFEDNEEIIEG